MDDKKTGEYGSREIGMLGNREKQGNMEIGQWENGMIEISVKNHYRAFQRTNTDDSLEESMARDEKRK